MASDIKPMRAGEYAEKDGKNYLIAQRETVYEAQDTTVVLWTLCNGERTIKEIRKQMIVAMGVEEDDVSTDLVKQAIDELKGMGLIL